MAEGQSGRTAKDLGGIMASAAVGHLVVRADASAEMGAGHFMRCLALAQGWKDSGGAVTFVTSCSQGGLLGRLRRESFCVEHLSAAHPNAADWRETRGVLAKLPGAWVVVDGYHFDESYHSRVRETGHRLLVIDDMAHLGHYCADIVLNQNLHAKQLHYRCDPGTVLLLGTRYVLLRREFFSWTAWRREVPEVGKRVLVTLGAGDVQNLTLKVVEALEIVNVPRLEAKVVVGGSNPHFGVLEKAAKRSKNDIQLLRDAGDMPGLMGWADVAVSSAGSTCWELLYMGLAGLVIICSGNQEAVGEGLSAEGLAVNLGWHQEVDAEIIRRSLMEALMTGNLRLEAKQRGRVVVDGHGRDRAMLAMNAHLVRLRPVKHADCRLLYGWVSDPDVRAMSFSESPIAWGEHVAWFDSKLRDEGCRIYIGLDQSDKPIGQVRLDIVNEHDAQIDVSVDKGVRGLGYGSMIIDMAVRLIFQETAVSHVHAFVKAANRASREGFRKAGFQPMPGEVETTDNVVHLVRSRTSRV